MSLAERVAARHIASRTWVHLGGDLEGSFDGFRYVDFRVIGQPETRMFASKEIFENALDLFPAVRVAARFKKKMISEKGNPIYTYSERQVALRNKKKAERLEKLRGNIGKLKTQMKKDLHSGDVEKARTALAVALMDHTSERVGNPQSAAGESTEDGKGHFGVTGWMRKHVSFGKGMAMIKYVGKSGIKQEKHVTDKAILKALRAAYDDEGEGIFEYKGGGRIDAAKVNEYLAKFDITAKDIRGYNCNSIMKDALVEARSKGGKLPEDKKEREKKLKKEFDEVLKKVAEEVGGHTPSTLRNQYLVPSIEVSYLKDGSVTKTMTSSIVDRWGALCFGQPT
jgi:DNA topoisomerase IB